VCWPAHGVVKLEKPFIDARVKIQPLVDEMMRSVVIIKSKAECRSAPIITIRPTGIIAI
jgi:hypothetical protein